MTDTRRTKKRRRRATGRAGHASQRDDGRRQAITNLHNAIHALTDPQPSPTGHGTTHSRYMTLRHALYQHRAGAGTHNHAHTIPTSIDVLKYCMEIDLLAHNLIHTWPADHCQISDRHEHPTIRALRETLTHKFHSRDNLDTIHTHTTTLLAYVRKIDDLFAPAPVYLPNPCPHCAHTHTHKINDEGEQVRTPALAVTAERGAACQQCHATWPPDRLPFLGLMLGYRPLPGVITA